MRIDRLIGAAAVGVLAAACTGLPGALRDPEVAYDVMSASEAVAADNARVTAQTGEIVDIEAERALDRVTAALSRRRPGLFAGAENGDPAKVYIKGHADRFVRRRIEAAPRGSIVLVEGMRYSLQELDEQADQLSDALVKIGYREFTLRSDETTGELGATVRRQPGLPASVARLRAALPTELADHTRLDIVDHSVGVDY